MKKTFLIFVSFFLVKTCAAHEMRDRMGIYPKALFRISIDMEKQEVEALISKPDIVRYSSKINGKTLYVWEYNVYRTYYDGPYIRSFKEIYWLYFKDNKLIGWDKVIDANDEARKIQEIKAQISN